MSVFHHDLFYINRNMKSIFKWQYQRYCWLKTLEKLLLASKINNKDFLILTKSINKILNKYESNDWLKNDPFISILRYQALLSDFLKKNIRII